MNLVAGPVAGQPHRVLGEKRLSRVTPPRPAGRPRPAPPAYGSFRNTQTFSVRSNARMSKRVKMVAALGLLIRSWRDDARLIVRSSGGRRCLRNVWSELKRRSTV